MPLANPGGSVNRLLSVLGGKEHEHFVAGCELIELPLAQSLGQRGQRIEQVYFPLTSVISLIAPHAPPHLLGLTLIGSEGMLGASLILGLDETPIASLVQNPGLALRMDRAPFRHQLTQNPVLLRELQRYLYVMTMQVAQTALCTRFHVVVVRLARWLLMTQDRLNCADFYLTHEFLADMLGVRRVGITRAATLLQNHSLISYSRGQITILDRSGLEVTACHCYETDNEIYLHILTQEHHWAKP